MYPVRQSSGKTTRSARPFALRIAWATSTTLRERAPSSSNTEAAARCTTRTRTDSFTRDLLRSLVFPLLLFPCPRPRRGRGPDEDRGGRTANGDLPARTDDGAV